MDWPFRLFWPLTTRRGPLLINTHTVWSTDNELACYVERPVNLRNASCGRWLNDLPDFRPQPAREPLVTDRGPSHGPS